MPAIPPRLAETPSQLRQILSCDGTQSSVLLIGAIGVCFLLLLCTRRAASHAANEKGAFEYSEKRSERDIEFVWPPPGQPTSAPQPMYASATSEQPMFGGQRYDAAGGYPQDMLPVRRTSYTKQIGDVNLQGEIMVGDGWTRHTRVYGGGVCLACEDSKKKQKMIMSSQAVEGVSTTT